MNKMETAQPWCGSPLATPPVCMSIAGLDPSGGAGILADVKTFSALGCYGCAAITSIACQNTLGVTESIQLTAREIAAQAIPVFEDLHPVSLKVGMLGNADAVCEVAELIARYNPRLVVLDPVMVSSSGHPLLDRDALLLLCENLLPRVTLLTPNLHELAALTQGATGVEGARWLIRKYGVSSVLVKGGHRTGEPNDLWVSSNDVRTFAGQRIHTRNDHGTGCTLSSAIAAFHARGLSLPDAVGKAKQYVHTALEGAMHWNIGEGHGPMKHFF